MVLLCLFPSLTSTLRAVCSPRGMALALRIQERYADFADYYDILLVPARPGLFFTGR